MSDNTDTSFDIPAFIKGLTKRPGIYKMLDHQGDIIYIGKAKNLKNRVSSYFKGQNASPKQKAMVTKIARIEVTVTHTENEALLLESQQIKRRKPRYNICLRDDRSYPYIYLSNHAFPQLTFHRGSKKKTGKYFGPYPSANAAKESLKLLQKLFPVRQCDDSVYNNRSRPCLQYQIKRCTAPCVGLITQENYASDVQKSLIFLEGKGNDLIDQLIRNMELAAQELNFEHAANIRDQIARLRTVMEQHFIGGERGNLDIIACAAKAHLTCIQVFFIRNGQHLGNKAFFPAMIDENTPAVILQAFISQYYLERGAPNELIVSHELNENELLNEYLSAQSKHLVSIVHHVRGDRAKWLQMAITNAENALQAKIASRQDLHDRYLALQNLLHCSELPKRLECFDISHTQGQHTVASCVVFDQQGPIKSAYRRFNIEDITPGDDYAAIYQAVSRRFKRIKQNEIVKPDVLFIDGGQGQVQQAQKALIELDINNVMIVGVSKGPDRKPGMEKLILAGQKQPLDVNPQSSALLLIQYIRDEAHRFAITGHKQRRAKAVKQSVLETVSGLGAKRRQILLKQFGGLQGVASASIDALCSVDGISLSLAQRIYALFHQDED